MVEISLWMGMQITTTLFNSFLGLVPSLVHFDFGFQWGEEVISCVLSIIILYIYGFVFQSSSTMTINEIRYSIWKAPLFLNGNRGRTSGKTHGKDGRREKRNR